MTRRRTLLATVLVLVVALGACGGDGDDEETDASTTTEATTSDPDPADAAESSTTTAGGDGSSTTVADGSTTTPPGDLPGEPVEIYPYEGAVLAVVGVAADDTLNVRSGPGTDFDVVVELGPLSEDATATGHNRTVEDSFWAEVEADDTTGWVNVLYVAQAGSTTDVTADLGTVVGGETMVDIAEDVAALRAPSEEGPQPTVTIVDGPEVGDVGEITVDVIGLADDSLKGERLHIIASPDASGEGFTVTTVEATALCARGVTADGLCT
jgi:hypothetical protein